MSLELDTDPSVDTEMDTDISVAITNPGGRLDKLTIPLKTTPLNVNVSPDDPFEHDVVLIDMAGLKMIKTIAMADEDTSLVYRVRGNLWRASRYWTLGAFKSIFLTNILFKRLDGAVVADQYLEYLWHDRTQNTSTAPIGLAIEEDEWQNVEHESTELRLLTLTNLDYRGKLDPILNSLLTIEGWLKENGGEWIIGGDGRFDGELADAVEDFDHIHFPGFVDAKSKMQEANVLYHPSEFDIQIPNAILEGMASHLPVVTNGFQKFIDHDRLLSVRTKSELVATLDALKDSSAREQEGERNLEYVREQHSPEIIGEKYVRFFQEVSQ